MLFHALLAPWLVSMLLALSMASGRAPNLSIDPQQGFEPLTVHAKVRIEPDYLNSWLCLTWNSVGGMAGRSCSTLDGQYAPSTKYFKIRDLTVGEYQFVATLYRANQLVKSETRAVIVTGRQ